MALFQYERFGEVVDLEEIELGELEHAFFSCIAADLEHKLRGLPNRLTVVVRLGATGQSPIQLRGPEDLIERAYELLGAVRPS